MGGSAKLRLHAGSLRRNVNRHRNLVYRIDISSRCCLVCKAQLEHLVYLRAEVSDMYASIDGGCSNMSLVHGLWIKENQIDD